MRFKGKKQPITYTVLENIHRILSEGCISPYVDTLMKAVCCIAFFGFLRCGEFTVTGQFNSTVHLCIDDIAFHTEDALEHLQLKLKVSKCDPFRKGILLSLHKLPGAICPWKTMKAYLCIRQRTNVTGQQPLFVTEDGNPLTRSVFLTYLKRILDVAGLDANVYSGHSFRSGAATTCASARVEDHLIKTLGRWSSDCYQRYIRTSQQTIRHAQLSMTK